MRHLAFLALNISFHLINPLLCNQPFICPPYTTRAPVPHTVLTHHVDPPSSSPLTSHYHPLLSGHPPHPAGAPLQSTLSPQHPVRMSSSLCSGFTVFRWVAPLWGRDTLLTVSGHDAPRGATLPHRASPLPTQPSPPQAAQPLHAAQAKLPRARLSPVWVPFSSHADTSILPWATTAHQPPRPPTHTHTHSTCSAPPNGLCTSCSGRRKKGKEEEEKRPQLTLVEETVIILSHQWSRPWIHAYWMIRKCSAVTPQIPWISFLWAVFFFFLRVRKREKERVCQEEIPIGLSQRIWWRDMSVC